MSAPKDCTWGDGNADASSAGQAPSCAVTAESRARTGLHAAAAHAPPSDQSALHEEQMDGTRDSHAPGDSLPGSLDPTTQLTPLAGPVPSAHHEPGAR